ncbi:EscU/YscU/HrcU family type III secretion system export apparatus switch protein [Celeribacter neptunius]|uniref:Flagellar biosynthetic protein FlhB n=1 Tax=Celeribacter neptunius TaxID=588602 RepID=A0A1I3SSQ7_9RHOB|nr:flagellar type III secretion system protein FlhB [Celeribacter neptunius]SFJ61380.1 flagellar biosynthetic protein FlhB [Celeribacter neptunius]
MAEGDDDDDKQYEPSQKRLDDARKKGEIPRSNDLTTAAAYFGFIATATALGAASLQRMATALQSLLANADLNAEAWFEGSGRPWTMGVMQAIGGGLLPWFMIPALLALLVIFATRSLVFAPSKLEPKLSKISPISNAKNKFGRSGLFEFGKSFFKLSIYSIVLGVYLYTKLPMIMSTMSLSPGIVAATLVKLTVGFMVIVLMISLVIGGVDYLFQYNEHMRKHRMSRKEMVDESKEQEGDPHFKHKRRQKGYDIVMNQMLNDVKEADVVIVNPTHYAVALKWDRMNGGAPICVAKGVDEIAARIREVANENNVPIHRDPPTARALYAAIEIGEEVLPEHYRAVAASIRFAEQMRSKMKQQFGK